MILPPERWVDHALLPGTLVKNFARGQVRTVADFSEKALRLQRTTSVTGRGKRLGVKQRLVNRSGKRMKFLFASEMNFKIKDAHVNRTGEIDGVKRFSVVDPMQRVKLSLSFTSPAKLWCFPRESGAGLNRVYHGACLTALWAVDLAPAQDWTVSWKMELENA